jgi:hypothetical protein
VALDAVITAVGNVLRDLPGVDQVLTAPPAKLPDDRCFIVYPDPGDVTLLSHGGSTRNSVYQAADVIRVDFHIRAARDAMAEAEPDARLMLSLTRDALISAGQRTAFNGTVIALRGLRTDVYGPLEYWSGDTSFGFQLGLDITHAVEVSAGKVA